MKFRIKRIFPNADGYRIIHLVDMEANNWESEITLRLTDTEIERTFPALRVGAEFLLSL